MDATTDYYSARDERRAACLRLEKAQCISAWAKNNAYKATAPDVKEQLNKLFGLFDVTPMMQDSSQRYGQLGQALKLAFRIVLGSNKPEVRKVAIDYLTKVRDALSEKDRGREIVNGRFKKLLHTLKHDLRMEAEASPILSISSAIYIADIFETTLDLNAAIQPSLTDYPQPKRHPHAPRDSVLPYRP